MRWPTVACTVLVLLGGCLVPKEPERSETPWFSMIVSPVVLGNEGDTVTVQVAFHVPVTHRYMSPDGCGGADDVQVEVVNDGGERIPLYEYHAAGGWKRLCTAAMTDFTIAAGRYTSVFHWNGLAEPADELPLGPHSGRRVTAGSYAVVVEHGGLGLRDERAIAVMPLVTEG